MTHQIRAATAAIACCFTLGAVPSLCPAEEPAPGRLLTSQCAQCHGTDTNPFPGFENLAGKDFVDIYDDLLGMLMENDADEMDLMTHQAQGYSFDQLELIAAYLASLPRR